MRKFAAIGVVVIALAAAGFGAWRIWFSPAPAAFYLSVGDGTQYGCCSDRTKSSPELFRRYLVDRLNRDVVWVTTASGYQTSDDFIEGWPGSRVDPLNCALIPDTLNGRWPASDVEPQLDCAVHLIEQYRRDHRKVAAITLSIGGNDLVEMGARCPTGTKCLSAYNAALVRLGANLDRIYSRITDAKEPKTPLLVLLYYNASDCGQRGVDSSPTELGVLGWNDAIRDIATRHGATLVDLYVPFKGNACKYIAGLDANDAGHAIIAETYERAYETATK